MSTTDMSHSSCNVMLRADNSTWLTTLFLRGTGVSWHLRMSPTWHCNRADSDIKEGGTHRVGLVRPCGASSPRILLFCARISKTHKSRGPYSHAIWPAMLKLRLHEAFNPDPSCFVCGFACRLLWTYLSMHVRFILVIVKLWTVQYLVSLGWLSSLGLSSFPDRHGREAWERDQLAAYRIGID